MRNDGIFISDNKNYILDCSFEQITDPVKLESAINNIPGVIENGLFLDIADIALVGFEEGVKLFGKSL